MIIFLLFLIQAEEIRKYIEETKQEIEKYSTQVEELLFILKDTSKNNVVKKPNLIFDKIIFENKINENEKSNNQSFPPYIVMLICSVGLFIGKILSKLV